MDRRSRRTRLEDGLHSWQHETELALPAPERVVPPKGATPMPLMTAEQHRRYGMDTVPGPNPLAPDLH